MAKCDLCGKKIDETFLNKIVGAYVKVNKKTKVICNECQSKFSMKEIKDKLK